MHTCISPGEDYILCFSSLLLHTLDPPTFSMFMLMNWEEPGCEVILHKQIIILFKFALFFEGTTH